MIKNILFFISILLLGACSIDEGNISGTITNARRWSMDIFRKINA